MDKVTVFVKSSYQRDFSLASLGIVYQVSCNKKQKSIKSFNRKVGQRYVTKISSSCPVLHGEIFPLHFEI